MRIIVQRVKSASVSVESKTIGKIGKGYFVLLGIKEKDDENDVEFLVNKLIKLRVMADDRGKMNLSIKDSNSEMLIVSQFTLYADTSGGNRPSFIKAANPILAEKLYKLFILRLKENGITVKTGEFGSYMKINTNLDGPVTIIIESTDKLTGKTLVKAL